MQPSLSMLAPDDGRMGRRERAGDGSTCEEGGQSDRSGSHVDDDDGSVPSTHGLLLPFSRTSRMLWFKLIEYAVPCVPKSERKRDP
jgi:hypothetical protein